MIRAKTTRGAQDSAQPYAFADGAAKGGLPQAIAMGIISVALYLRSMVSSRAEPMAPESPEPEEAGRSAPVPETLAAPAPEEAAQEDPAPQTPASPEATAFITSFPVSTGANVVSLFAPGAGAQAGRGPAPAPFAQAPAPNLWDGVGEMPARSAPIDVSRLFASAEGAALAEAQMPSDTGTPDGGGSPPASGAGAPPPPRGARPGPPGSRAAGREPGPGPAAVGDARRHAEPRRHHDRDPVAAGGHP